MLNYFKKLSVLIISIFFTLIISIFAILWFFSNDLPDYKFLSSYEPPISSRVYSSDGQLIAEFAIQKRLFLPFEEVPKNVINSFLSAEDKNFFKHPGVDTRGIVRAVIKNVKNYLKSKRLEGASTITQQVAKNFLLTNEVTFTRKIKEAILAFRIERALSKERIMELYLNEIYLGQGTYGIAAASLEYFDKPVSELNYEETALLAALPKAPNKYNPYKSKKFAKQRRNAILKNLLENKYISFNEYQKLIKKDILLKRRKIELLEEANYFSEEIRRILKEEYGYDKIYKSGLTIKTPLVPRYQSLAVKALRSGLESYDRRHGWRGVLANYKSKDNWPQLVKDFKIGKDIDWELARVKKVEEFYAEIETEDKELGRIKFSGVEWTKKNIQDLFKDGDIIYVKKNENDFWELKQLPKVNGSIVVMDPFTGRVLALVGGFSYNLSEFNRATQAYRQPGSAFKPFVYALALENGFTPSTLVLDAPMVLYQGKNLKMWKPENYGKKFYGLSTFRTGLEKSRNLMTVRIAQDVGIDKLTQFSKKLEIYNDPKEHLSISLGSAETTLLKLTSGYCSFLNNGKKTNPVLIDRIQDRRGITIYNSDKRECINCDQISYLSEEVPILKNNSPQIISPQTSYQVVSLLQGVVQRGTGKKLRKLKLNLAGKTGTTNKNTDTWFIGFNSNIVVGVYVAFDEPAPLGKYETGAKTALPIFKKFMSSAIKKNESLPFQIPNGIQMMIVNPKTGEKLDFNSKNGIYESFKEKNILGNENKKIIFNYIKKHDKQLKGFY